MKKSKSEKTKSVQGLQEEKIPGIFGIDTRKLTQKLRENGVMLGKIVTGNQDIDFVNPNAENLVEKVSPKKLAIYQPNPKSEIRFSTENLLKASNPKQYQNSNDKNSKRFEFRILKIRICFEFRI